MMSSIMRARSALTGRGRMGGHRRLLSQAEGCWTFDARDRMPQSSRLTAHPRTTIAEGVLFAALGVLTSQVLASQRRAQTEQEVDNGVGAAETLAAADDRSSTRSPRGGARRARSIPRLHTRRD